MKTFNLLNEPVITVQTGDQMTLPEVMDGLSNGLVTSFPNLISYHAKVWHCFLVQLAVLAITKFDKEPASSDEWAQALSMLTNGDEYWDLISEPGKPAFMQSPLNEDDQAMVHASSRRDPKRTPDALDILVTANNHYVKQNRNYDASMEDWLYALIVHQTESGYGGVMNYGTARAASGNQSRVFAGVFPIAGKFMTIDAPSWFQQDVQALLSNRAAASSKEQQRFKKPGVLWHLKWDYSYVPPKPKKGEGKEEGEKKQKKAVIPKNSLPVTSLDPLYIDQARVLKLFRYNGRIEAIALGSTAERVHAAEFQKDTDPWAILAYKDDKKGQVGYTPWGYPEKSPRAFDYRMISDFLTNDEYRFAHRDYVDWEADNLGIFIDFVRKGQGKTLGHKRIFVPLPRAAKDIFFGGEDKNSIMKQMIELTKEYLSSLSKSVRVYVARGDMDRARDIKFIGKPATGAAVNMVSDQAHLDIDGYFMREWAAIVDVADDDEALEERLAVFENRLKKTCWKVFDEFLSRGQVPSSTRLRSESRARDALIQGMTRKAA